MSFNRKQFEKEVKTKLSSRVVGTMTEETLFLKSFKYFDLDNSGSCSKQEFLKALVKIGVNSVNEENINDVFNLYDTNGNGELDYKEFVGILFHSSSAPTQGKPEETKKKIISESEGIILKIREALSRRGVCSMITIGRNFKIIDDNNNHQLEFEEFSKAAKDFKFGLTDAELKKAFQCFDRKNTGTIDYEEFLRTIRGDMNPFRLSLVRQAFDILDINHNEVIELEEIATKYNARMHKEVQSGKKTEEEILEEFMGTFQEHHYYLNGDDADDQISLDEFIEYYQHVSMSIDDDAYFEVMMNNAWRMNSHTTGNNEKKGWSNVDGKNGEDKLSDQYQKAKAQGQFESTGNALVDKFKAKVISRGCRGIISLVRIFKVVDDNNSKGLELDEFQKAMKDFHIDFTAKEIIDLFNIIDINNSGLIDYEEFLRLLIGNMNIRRKAIVQKAFKILDTNCSGAIEIGQIKSSYNPKQHPKVISGEKTEEEIIEEFIETFETYHNITKGTRNRRVTEEEFIGYYNNLSMCIDNDDLFEEIIRKAWKIDQTKEPFKKAMPNELGCQKARIKLPSRTPYGIDKEKTVYGTSTNPQCVNVNTFAEKTEEIIGKFKQCLTSRGVRGIMSLRRSFMLIDEDNSKTIDMGEFTKMIHEFKLKISDVELKTLFNHFDKDKSGSIDYEEFVNGIQGEMTKERKAIISKAFEKLDKENCGKIDVDVIRQEFNAKNCPDVRGGKKTEEEAIAEFIDVVEYHFNLLNEDKYLDGLVSLDDFIDFYRNYSIGILDDKLFEVLIISSWDLNMKCPYQRGWKGENIN